MPAMRDNPEVPREDWRCMEVADIREKHGAPDAMPCEMCGTESIRFVHVMEHDNYDEALGVCVSCAEGMTGDSVNPRRVEEKIRKKSLARDHWLDGNWYLSVRDNWITSVDGVNMGVFLVKFQQGKWACRIENKFFPGMYPSMEEAKHALFDEVWKQKGLGLL